MGNPSFQLRESAAQGEPAGGGYRDGGENLHPTTKMAPSIPTPEDHDDRVIRKPDTDKRLYKRLALENGLIVLLVSDPQMAAEEAEEAEEDPGEASSSSADDESMEEASDDEEDEEDQGEASTASTKKAAAAMCVCTGSFSDPENIPGVSHFLEHMLFMGSEAYPSENEYDSFLSKNGGSSNAYTDTECTNYYFDVQPKGLYGALQRFSAFFVSPLCRADAVDREVQAVESEFVQALQNNACRLSQLRCHTAAEGHVYAKFGWGNHHSLIGMPTGQGLEPREELLKYYRAQYSAERMSLVILGSEDLRTLEEWTRDLFGKVPSGLGPPVTFADSPAPFRGGWAYALPMTREGHELHVLFQLPCLHKVYRSKPDDYVSHLIGHEGRNSLLSLLKSKGLVTHISAGVAHDGYDRNTIGYMFNVTFVLTELGLKCGRDGFGIVEYLFAYINMVRAKGPQEWVWTEIAAASNIKFKFAEEEEAQDYVQELAVSLRLYRAEHILEGDYLHDKWDPQLVRETLDKYFVPQNMRIEVQSSSFKDRAFVSEEPWFKIPYEARELTREELEKLSKASIVPGLDLPEQNEFLPTDFGIKSQDFLEEERAGYDAAGEFKECPVPEALMAPPLLVELSPGDTCEAWYKFDRFFQTPRASAILSFHLSQVNATPERHVLLKLSTKVLDDFLTEMTYLADVAGMTTSVYSCQDRLEIKVEGFSHKISILLKKILDGMSSFCPTKERFAACKEGLVRGLKNSVVKPARHATYLRLISLQLESWPLEFQLEALEALEIAKVTDFVSGEVFARSRLQMLIQGNVSLAEARAIIRDAKTRLAPAAPEDGAPRDPLALTKKMALLKPGQTFAHAALAQNPSEKNSASEVYVQIGPENHRDYAALSLLEQIIYEPFFDTLRTKEQLGYSVSCGLRNTYGILGFCFSVVSSKCGPLHIETRVDAFLAGFLKDLDEMTEQEYQDHVKSAIEAKQQQDPTLTEETERHWDQISMGRYDFFQRQAHAEEIGKIGKAGFLDWFRRNFAEESDEVRKMCARVFSAGVRGEKEVREEGGTYCAGDLENFREETFVLCKDFELPDGKFKVVKEEASSS